MSWVSKNNPLVTPLTEALRGGIVESRHRGAIAVVDSHGRLLSQAGDPDLLTFWRSSSKPLQALPVVITGAAERFGFETRHLAVMCGSHTGKEYHLRAVAEILERAGVPADALRCQAAGRPPLPHGCSGKHAGMLATAAHLGEPLEGYREPGHPVQRRIRQTLADLAGIAPGAIGIGVDGCGVPTFAMPLRLMALAFARLTDPAALESGLASACTHIAASMWTHPELLSGADGDTSDVTSALVKAHSGRIVAKSGAEALFVTGLVPGIIGERGVGIAVKAEDGGNVQRSCYLATMEALRQLGAIDESALEHLAQYLGREIHDVHGDVVGAARPCFTLGA
jgi:L-asparaginase II